MLGKLGITMQKMMLDIWTIYKINSNLVKTLNVRTKTIELLKKKIREKAQDTALGNCLLAMTPKA